MIHSLLLCGDCWRCHWLLFWGSQWFLVSYLGADLQSKHLQCIASTNDLALSFQSIWRVLYMNGKLKSQMSVLTEILFCFTNILHKSSIAPGRRHIISEHRFAAECSIPMKQGNHFLRKIWPSASIHSFILCTLRMFHVQIIKIKPNMFSLSWFNWGIVKKKKHLIDWDPVLLPDCNVVLSITEL